MSKEGKAKESSKYKRDSSDEDNTERIRVGKDYQAIMPSTLLRPSNMETIPEKALLMWTPSELADIDLDQYIRVSGIHFRVEYINLSFLLDGEGEVWVQF